VQVGLYADGVLTASAITVTTSDALTGSFRYAPVTPVDLVPGTTYTILAGFPDEVAFGFADSPAFSYHPSVTVTAVQSLSGGSGSFPSAPVGNPDVWANEYQSVSFLLCD